MITMTNGSAVATTGLAANTSITVNEDQYRYLLTDATGRVTNVTWVSGTTNPLGATTTTTIPQFAPDGSVPEVFSGNLTGNDAGITTGTAANANLTIPFFSTGGIFYRGGGVTRNGANTMPVTSLSLAGIPAGGSRSDGRIDAADTFTLFNITPPATPDDGLFDADGLRDANGNIAMLRAGTTLLPVIGIGRRVNSAARSHVVIQFSRPTGNATFATGSPVQRLISPEINPGAPLAENFHLSTGITETDSIINNK